MLKILIIYPFSVVIVTGVFLFILAVVTRIWHLLIQGGMEK